MHSFFQVVSVQESKDSVVCLVDYSSCRARVSSGGHNPSLAGGSPTTHYMDKIQKVQCKVKSMKHSL